MGIGVKVKVWGDYALFSRPEMKVERCSYDVMTPSAARGTAIKNSMKKMFLVLQFMKKHISNIS